MSSSILDIFSKIPVTHPHRPLAKQAGFAGVPTLADITAATMETAGDAKYSPPVSIRTPYQFIKYMVEMMEIRGHTDFPTDPANVVKQVWENNVQAIDYLAHSKLGLDESSEEHHLIFNMSACLCRCKLRDQLPQQKQLFDTKAEELWNAVLQDGRDYVKRNDYQLSNIL